LQVLANPIYQNDFMQMVNYVTVAIDILDKNTIGSTTRWIGELNIGSNRSQSGRSNNAGGRSNNASGGRGGRGG
jgi:hypothetical protein